MPGGGAGSWPTRRGHGPEGEAGGDALVEGGEDAKAVGGGIADGAKGLGNLVSDAAGATWRCFAEGERTCLKVAGIIAAGHHWPPPAPGIVCRRLEEFYIRRDGGPTTRTSPDGSLANRRHQMREERYARAGGDIE